MLTITHPRQIGVILSGRRKTLKLSQTKVASRLALSQNRLSELESRPETITVAQLLALINVLGLELSLTERTAIRSRVEC